VWSTSCPTPDYGSFDQTNDQLSLGSHTERFAYYGSLNGNRSDLGLMTPASAVIHDLESGLGGFTDVLFNATPEDQLRAVASVRSDHYQIPNTPEQQAAGTRDVDTERDVFFNFSWVHTFDKRILLTISPFYHFNRANYLGGPDDQPFVLNDDRASHYVGGQAVLSRVVGKHNARVGGEAFAQHDATRFDLRAADASPTSVDLALSAGSKRVLGFAEEAADGLAHQHIGTEHLVLGLAREENGLAARALREARFDAIAFRAVLSRTGEFATRTAQTKSRSAGNVVEIHGDTWDVRSVRGMAEYYRKFHWERRTWVCRDALAFRSDGRLYLYVGQPYDAEKGDLMKGGWTEDHCAICWWRLSESTDPEHGVGHTNGQDWLCNECYQRFVSADRSDKL